MGTLAVARFIWGRVGIIGLFQGCSVHSGSLGLLQCPYGTSSSFWVARGHVRVVGIIRGRSFHSGSPYGSLV